MHYKKMCGLTVSDKIAISHKLVQRSKSQKLKAEDDKYDFPL